MLTSKRDRNARRPYEPRRDRRLSRTIEVRRWLRDGSTYTLDWLEDRRLRAILERTFRGLTEREARPVPRPRPRRPQATRWR
jgi:hypothetical protein